MTGARRRKAQGGKAGTTETRLMHVGRQRMRVAVRRGVGRPLLMCNGIGATLDLFEPFTAALDPEIPLVLFDAPGVGGSDPARLPYTFFTFVRDLREVLDRLEIEDVDVLGISWGGGLAQQFAFQLPKRCRRLVLAATATGALMVPGGPRVLGRMATPRRHRDPNYAASIAGDIYGGRLRSEPELVRQLLSGHGKLASRRGYAMQLLAAAGWTSLPFLPMIRQPTLILAGDDDPIIPLVNARIAARLMPHATLHVYHDGHLGLLSSADELGPVVSAFLRPDKETMS